MAMSVPKMGMSRFMKEGTMVGCFFFFVELIFHFQHFKGIEEAVQRNIEACVELAQTVRSCYGPNGLYFFFVY
jgi:hypothetical protein